ISDQEKKKILYDFNDTNREYPVNKTIPELFAEQVEQTPDHTAVVGAHQLHELHEKGTRGLAPLYITYKELNKQANQLAQLLRKKGVKPDTTAAIMAERSIEMIIAVYAILKAGGAYLPIDPNYPRERIQHMVQDSSTKFLLTQTKFSHHIKFHGEIINIQDPAADHKGTVNLKKINTPENLVYMIYTSGSTGKPKGVTIKTRGFINLLHWYTTEFSINNTDCVILIAPISFDLAQKNLFAPLIKGAVLYLASPGLPDYHELSHTIAKQQITLINCAPSVFYPLMDFNSIDNFIKLKSLRYVFLGGEPIKGDKLARWFNSKNCRCELVNTYGPTECTDIASAYRVSKKEILGKTNIPIGSPIYNVSLYVLDNHLRVLPIGIMGELCIGGIGVSTGYHKNPRLTAEKFKEWHPHFTTQPLHHSTIYKTGDLARWLPDGNIEFLGRLDFQVKVRGNRIELGEIESHLITHPAVKEAAVNAISGPDGDNDLCAYIVFDSGTTVTSGELRDYLANQLPDYMIPPYFVPMETIPLTPSGKVNRKALPLPGLTGKDKTGYTPPRNEIEKKLVDIWSGVLNADHSSISINNNFFRLGGHSLNATIAISRIHQYFNIRLTLADIFKTPTIRGLARTIKGAVRIEDKYYPIEKVEKKEYYLLSSAQKRLYILDQVEFASTSYNMPEVYQLAEEPDKSRLEQAFRQLIQRHESFRTSFIMPDDEPVQQIHDEVKFEIEYFDLATENTEGVAPPTSTIKNFIRPFGLSRPPLLRAGLIKTENEKSLLLVDMHHIISDGISMTIFQKELAALYHSKQLPPPIIQYKDYAQWQHKESRKEKMKRQEEYWLKEFKGEIPVLNLPTDFPRPTIQSFAGNTLYFQLGKEQAEVLNLLAATEHTTLFMILFAIFNILLAKLGGQENIVVGTPTAGRRHADLENIIGMFINTLALKNYPSGDKKFSEFLAEVKTKTLDVFENQEYQFEDLVELLNVPRDASRNPLFDVMFVLQNIEEKETHQPGLEMTPYKYLNNICKFDMTLITEETDVGLSFDLGYCTRLFKEETIRFFISYLKKIISLVTTNPQIKISEIEFISDQEKKKILYDFNNTNREYPADKTIPGLFAEQAEQTPDHTAVVGAHQLHELHEKGTRGLAPLYITYKELNKQSLQLANLLLEEKGVKPSTMVAIMMEKSLEMIIGILGILKAGCAYVPLDPQAPLSRTKYLLQECGASL
ncbi:MAG: amino acid adenylation domain-containing protein, partial [Candidatus Aminicenantes bacterium]